MNHGQSHYPQVEKTWNSDEPSQEWPAYQNYPKSAMSTHPVIKEPILKNCCSHLPQLRSVFMRKRLGIHGSVPRQKTLLTKNNKGSSHICQKNILIIPKTFGQIFCGLMRQQLDFLEGACPVTSGVKTTQHFIKRTSYPQSNMVEVVWWSGAVLHLQDLDLQYI